MRHRGQGIDLAEVKVNRTVSITVYEECNK